MGALEGMGLRVVEARMILWFGSVEVGVVWVSDMGVLEA